VDGERQGRNTTAVNSEDLYGTWRLVSYTRQTADKTKTDFPFGRSPRGILNYGRDGRMFAMIANDERPKVVDPEDPTDHELAGLFNTMAAYGGTYSVAGDQVTHHVDISWNGTWTGTDQGRLVRLDGGKLFITTELPDFVYSLVWQKLE
jgi:lipocalin-like protein